MGALLPLALVLFLGGPILAIMALVAVRRLERESSNLSLQQVTARIFALEQRLKTLEGAVTETRTASPTPVVAPTPPVSATEPPHPELPEKIQIHIPLEPGAPPPPQIPPAPLPSAPALPSSPAASSSRGVYQPISFDQKQPVDMESLIAGRWFNRIGIVALLIAVSYFLKLAFDNNWIGPSGRVAIGVVLGALMLPWSHWLLGKGYTYFSEGIAALGEATLFLSVWAGCQYYPLYNRDVGFAAMMAITAVMAAVAIGRNSQRIAVLSLLGGLLTPILASSGQNQQVVLFTYLLFLAAGSLVIQAKKGWNSLVPIAFVCCQIYFWGWYSEFFHTNSPLERSVFFATLFYLLFSLLPILNAMRGLDFGELDISMVLLNSFAYSGALFVLLCPYDKWPLTLLFLALAGGSVAIARLLPAPSENQSATARLLFAGLALTFLTLAIPIRLEGNWITLSFAVEGAILVYTGFQTASNFLRQSGYLLLAIAALRLLFLPPAGGPFLFNARFGAYAVMIACFAVALCAAQTNPSKIAWQEQVEVGIFAVVINVYALIALSLEFWDFFGKASTILDAALAQHLSLSILWTAYATALLIGGVQTKSALLRWQSLVLFGLVVGKVFIYDLSFLERGYRILSFFVLSAVLLPVAFVFTRKLAHQSRRS